jgi:succinate dehydrogenase/fumarate reductase-like Fe-S protein
MKHMTDKAVVKILTYNPETDKEAKLKTFEVPPEAWKGRKLIDTIRYIYENFAPALSFREPCRQGLCDGCLVLLNKKAVYACQTLSEKEMIVEPLPKHPVIKDLVVEFPSWKEEKKSPSSSA